MSDERNIPSGSAARQHERDGGNVQARQANVPVGGGAARQAESEGDAVNEAHGVRVAPRNEYRGLAVNLRSTAGARLVKAEPEKDWSARKASDYLPPQMKAELIAAGKLSEDGQLLAEDPPRSSPARPSQEETAVPAAAAAANRVSESQGAWNALTGFFRKLFS